MMGRPLGTKNYRQPDAGELKRIRAAWVDPERTMTEMMKTYRMSKPALQRLCADLPPRFGAEYAKRQAPMGLRRFL